MSKKEREPAISCDEQDWCSDWRKVLCYCGRPGVGRNIKRTMSKRARRRMKRELFGISEDLESGVVIAD